MAIVIKILKSLLYLVSGVFFVLSFVYNNIIYAIAGTFFFFLISFAIHECFHMLACLLLKAKVKEFKVLSFLFNREGKFEILTKPQYTSYVIFGKNKHSWFIYLLGIIGSTVVLTVFLILFLRELNDTIYHLYLSYAIISFIIPLLPIKGSDINNMLKRKGQ